MIVDLERKGSDRRSSCSPGVIPSPNLDASEGVALLLRVHYERVIVEQNGLGVVPNGDGDCWLTAQAAGFQVDVLRAVCPQQVWSHNNEPGAIGYENSGLAEVMTHRLYKRYSLSVICYMKCHSHPSALSK